MIGFCILLSALVVCDTWVFLNGYDSIFHEAKTEQEKENWKKRHQPPKEQGQMNHVIEIGKGELIVDTGLYEGQPAVFISKAPKAGVIGEKVSPAIAGPLDQLKEGDLVIKVPSEGMAIKLADLLCQQQQPKEQDDGT